MQSKLRKSQGTKLIAIIGDQDTVTGMLLAGIGQRNTKGFYNYFMVNQKTTSKEVDQIFKRFLSDPLISVILITQDISQKFLKQAIVSHSDVYPVILQIPAKQSFYDPKKDVVMQRAHRQLYGTDIS